MQRPWHDWGLANPTGWQHDRNDVCQFSGHRVFIDTRRAFQYRLGEGLAVGIGKAVLFGQRFGDGPTP